MISDRFRLPHFRKQSHSLDVDWKPADSGSDMEVLGSFSRQRITHQDPPILLFNRSILQTVNRGVETTALSAPPCTAWSSCRACDPPGKPLPTLTLNHSTPAHQRTPVVRRSTVRPVSHPHPSLTSCPAPVPDPGSIICVSCSPNLFGKLQAGSERCAAVLVARTIRDVPHRPQNHWPVLVRQESWLFWVATLKNDHAHTLQPQTPWEASRRSSRDNSRPTGCDRA